MIYRFLWLVIAALLAFNAAAQLATKKDTANGVTVVVTPANLAAGAKTWDFSILTPRYRSSSALPELPLLLPAITFRCSSTF